MIVGFVDGGVETICYDAAVGIAVTEFDGVRTCSVGHDAQSKMIVEDRNDREIFKEIGVFDRVSVSRAEESGAMWLVV